MNFTPASSKDPEQQLTADRVYYDFVTQRAILTGVVFHSIDPVTQIPITVRAETMRQLAHGEFTAEKADIHHEQICRPHLQHPNQLRLHPPGAAGPGQF